ncbi:hypothetical protein J3F84DRAFT_376178 [Trichoderma pleuroticola]
MATYQKYLCVHTVGDRTTPTCLCNYKNPVQLRRTAYELQHLLYYPKLDWSIISLSYHIIQQSKSPPTDTAMNKTCSLSNAVGWVRWVFGLPPQHYVRKSKRMRYRTAARAVVCTPCQPDLTTAEDEYKKKLVKLANQPRSPECDTCGTKLDVKRVSKSPYSVKAKVFTLGKLPHAIEADLPPKDSCCIYLGGWVFLPDDTIVTP